MKVSDINTEWEKDAIIERSDLGEESIKVARLHAKYLRLLTESKHQHRQAKVKAQNTRKLRSEYYRGELTRQELEEQGWEQYQGIRPTKSGLDKLLSEDTFVMSAEDRVEYYATMILQLEEIIRNINSRTWQIKNAIEYLKFTNGIF